jgi:CheY-like chemotaxis protein
MSRKKILIIDDDKDLRAGLNLRLRASNYDAVFAGDGVAAVSEAQRQQPDAILLDLGLPGGDGFLVLERLKSIPRLASIPVLIITARDSKGNQEKAASLGAEAFLQKPFENEELLSALRKALGD